MSRATRYLSASRRALAAALAALAALTAAAQVPDAPNPPRLVNDFACVLTTVQAQLLEDSLAKFDRRTSNQIAVVTLSDLGEMTPAEMAYSIGEQWGVGGKEHNNGVVILIKPKNDTRGQVFIATGYGLEGALPDAICKRIINTRMLPHFVDGDYCSGIWDALSEILPRAAGEYSDPADDDGGLPPLWVIVIVVVIAVILFSALLNDNNKGNSGNSGTMGSGGVFMGPIIFGSGLGRGLGKGGSGGFGGFGAGGSW